MKNPNPEPNDVRPMHRLIMLCIVWPLFPGCSTQSPAESESRSGSFNIPPPRLIIPEIKPVAMKPPPSFDIGALDVEGFIPMGAQLIGPYAEPGAPLADGVRIRHPTAEQSPSPDGGVLVYDDGHDARSAIVHKLTLKRRDSVVTHLILSTRASYDTMWSPKSDAFAVTHYVGGNTTDVFVISLRGDLKKVEVASKTIVETYFPTRFANLPTFAKAYRWSVAGELIVRGMAQTTEAPFERIGYELKVSPHNNEASATTFLRGYIQLLENQPRL